MGKSMFGFKKETRKGPSSRDLPLSFTAAFNGRLLRFGLGLLGF